jgi:hypothetical protein
MIYERYFETAERQRWKLETDIPWSELDVPLAKRDEQTLHTLRDAALIESFAPMFALKGLEAWWDSVEESAIASIQFYEEYKHYFALKKYLAAVGVEIPDRELIALREPRIEMHYSDRVRQLANYMISEHFTAWFYQRLLDRTEEPVLKTLLRFLVSDEFRHCNVYYSLLEERIARDRAVVDTVLDEVFHFRHQASEALGERVPLSMKNDFQALLAFWKRVERLTGVDLRDARRARGLDPETPL